MSNETKTLIVSETTSSTVDVPVKSDMGLMANADFIKYLLLFLIAFLLILIIANNPNSIYYSLTLPTWSPSLATFAVLFVLIFFFTAFSMAKADYGTDDSRATWFKWGVWIVVLLWLVGIFLLFQINNVRSSFWVFIGSLIVTIILMFMIGCQSTSSTLWLVPALLLEIFILCDLWNIISLNNL
jgi:tryptophan-rich sensory protein